VTLKNMAVRSDETPVTICQSARRDVPEDLNLQFYLHFHHFTTQNFRNRSVPDTIYKMSLVLLWSELYIGSQ